MGDLLQTFFGSGPFVPHGHCYLWHTPLVWLHVLSDGLTALAYYSIPIFLIALAHRRQDLPFRPLFWLFGGFIIFCGTTHWMEVATLWYPAYWLSGTIKALTALLSVWTALELIPLFPKAVALPSIEQYELANQALQQEVAERQKVETALRESQALNAKLSAAALKEKEDVLRLFAQYAPAGIAMLDQEMRYVMASQRWVDEYNLGSVESLIHRSHYEVFPEIPERWRQVNHRCLAGATEKCEEDRFIRADGRSQWSAWEVCPWITASGDIGGIIIFSEDITQRKQVEVALQLSEEQLRLALDFAQIGSWDWDLLTHQVTWNENHFRLLGLDPEIDEATYANWRNRVHPDDVVAVEEAVAQAIQKRTTFVEEYRIVRPDGSLCWVIGKGRALYDANSQPVRMVGVILDITDRKQAEIDLQALNAQLEQRVAERTLELKTLSDRLMEAQEIAHIGSWEYDITTGDIFWSDEIFRIYGLEPGQPEPDYESHLAQNFFPEDGQRLNECVRRALELAEPYEIEAQIIRTDGSQGWILAKGKPIVNEHNQVVRLVGVALDITERKAIEAQQQQLGQMKDDFLSTVSHELRSPLASIKMAIEMLELMVGQLIPVSTPGTDVHTKQQRLQRYLGILSEQCDQELELVNNLLDLQRLEADRIQVSIAPIDLMAWASNIAAAFEGRMQERQQHLQVRLPHELPPFSSDVDILTHVLRELLTNACKYTPPGETITVEVCPTPAHLQLRVSNSGVQIAQEDLERIFEKFYRIPKSDQWKQGGTGLGLALIQKQVEYLGGSLWAESDELGVHFVVRLRTQIL